MTAVEILWMDREYPVDEARLKIFFRLTTQCAIAFVQRFACLQP